MLATLACTSSIGPGATNMVTGAALATINRLPVLLLPSDTFATRVSDPVLQQLELPHDASASVNDAFRPFGGIRIEDDVACTDDAPVNLTPSDVDKLLLSVAAMVASSIGGVAGFGTGAMMIPVIAWTLGAKATVLLRNRDAEQPGPVQIPVVLDRKLCFAIVSRGAARKNALAELARPRNDVGLLVAQTKRVWIEDRCIERDLSGSSCVLVDWRCHLSRHLCRFQELIECRVERFRTLKVDEMPGTFKLDIGRGGDVGRHLRHHRCRRILVLRSR